MDQAQQRMVTNMSLIRPEIKPSTNDYLSSQKDKFAEDCTRSVTDLT